MAKSAPISSSILHRWHEFLQRHAERQKAIDAYCALSVDRVSIYAEYSLGRSSTRSQALASLTWLPRTDLQALFPFLIHRVGSSDLGLEYEALLRLPRAWLQARLVETASPWLGAYAYGVANRIYTTWCDAACYGMYWKLFLFASWRLALQLSAGAQRSADVEVREAAARDLREFAGLGVDVAALASSASALEAAFAASTNAVQADRLASIPAPDADAVAAWRELCAATDAFGAYLRSQHGGSQPLPWADLIGYALETGDGADALPQVLTFVNRSTLFPHYPALLRWASNHELPVVALRHAFSPNITLYDPAVQDPRPRIVQMSAPMLGQRNPEAYRCLIALYQRWRTWDAIALAHAAAADADPAFAEVGRAYLRAESLPVP